MLFPGEDFQTCLLKRFKQILLLYIPIFPMTLPSQLHLLFSNPLNSHHMCMGVGPFPEAWIVASRVSHPWRTDFPFHSSHQLPVAPQLQVEFHEFLLSPCWNFVWLNLVMLLWMQSKTYVSSSVQTCCCVQQISFVIEICSLASYSQFFCFLSRWPLSLGERNTIWMLYLVLSTPWSLTFCLLTNSRSLY